MSMERVLTHGRRLGAMLGEEGKISLTSLYCFARKPARLGEQCMCVLGWCDMTLSRRTLILTVFNGIFVWSQILTSKFTHISVPLVKLI